MQLDERLIIAPIRSTKSGMPGPMGPAGPKGEPGKDGLPPDHDWISTSLRFKRPDGSWGPATNLKGDKGADGSAGENKIQVEDQTGSKSDLEVIKYHTADSKITYDATDKSLSIKSVENSYELDWSIASKNLLPSGAKYTGAIVYVEDIKEHLYYDGSDWVGVTADQVDADKLYTLIGEGKWVTTKMSNDQKKVILDSRESFLGIFQTLNDLTASTVPTVSGQSFAIVEHPDNVPSNDPKSMLYVLVGGQWSPVNVNGNLLIEIGNQVKPFTHIKAGNNVTIDYDNTKREVTINSTGGGTGPGPDLDKYVKGENVRATNWATSTWDDTSKILTVDVAVPDYDKMKQVVTEGDNISFEKDPASGRMRIGASFNPDFTPYVRGELITTANGLKHNWDRTTQTLALNYEPSYTDLSNLVEAGDNIFISKGTGEKLKIEATYNPPVVDLSDYAKKENIKIPAGYWGTTEVDADDVNLKIKPTAQNLIDMFSDQSDANFAVDGDKVKISVKDGRERLYNALAKSSSGNEAMLKPGNQIMFDYDDTNKTITITGTANEFSEESIKATLPITSTYDSTLNDHTIGFSSAGFVNLTDQSGSNVDVGYDAANNKITYNVNRSLIPTIKVQKDTEAEASLSKLQVLNAGDAFQLQDDATEPGKKIGVLTMHDKYQVMGHASNVDAKLTNLTVRGDVPNQVTYDAAGNMVVDLTKTKFVGRVNSTADLPADAIAEKSYAYVKSADGYDTAYIKEAAGWVPHYPTSGMLLVEDGSPNKYDVIKQIKSNNAVSFQNGVMTINQSGIKYRHNQADDPLYQLEVQGPGVATEFDSATGSLKLTISGGSSTTVSPIKVTAKHQDGTLAENQDVREIVFDGDTIDMESTDISGGGKKVTVPAGITVVVDSDLNKISTKYDPTKHRGKLVFNYTNDASKRIWFACNGEKWFELASDDLTVASKEIIDRLSTQTQKVSDASQAKDRTGWFMVDKTANDIPEYTKPDGSKEKVDGFIFNFVNGSHRQQTFYPANTYQQPFYRNWDTTTSVWNEWVSATGATGADIQAAITHHNEQQDAHENLILPALVATTRTNWYEINDNQAEASLKGSLPLMLLHDNTGRGKIRPESTNNSSGLYIDRPGKYDLSWMFQITGTTTANGTLKLTMKKNDTDIIVEKSFSISTAGREFSAFKLKQESFDLVAGDVVSIYASYTGDSTWTEANKKEARIDAMKNYLVVEHEKSSSGSHIADTYRSVLGGLVTLPGFEAQILPDMSDPSIASFVEVTGGQYSETVVV